jgi:hypothetical protein
LGRFFNSAKGLSTNERDQLLSESLGLALQRWQGHYKGINAVWLRWATLEGELLPTPEEQERQRANRAEAQLLQTARNLLADEMTVEQIARVTGLNAATIAPLDLIYQYQLMRMTGLEPAHRRY